MTPSERFDAALWYAWGQIDAGVNVHVLTLDDGFAFAREQREVQRAYNDGETRSMDSILGAWDVYCQRRLNPGSFPAA